MRFVLAFPLTFDIFTSEIDIDEFDRLSRVGLQLNGDIYIPSCEYRLNMGEWANLPDTLTLGLVCMDGDVGFIDWAGMGEIGGEIRTF